MRKYSSVGKRLRKLRGNLSQREYAKKIGLPHKTYQRYEYGEAIPKVQVLEKISKIESVTIDWLLTGKLRGFEGMVLDVKSGIPASHLNITGTELALVDRLRKKGFPVSDDIINLADVALYGAAMKVFWESPDVPDVVNMIFYLKREGKFEEVSRMMRKIARVFFRGDSTKVEALKTFLEALAPGETKFDAGIQSDRKGKNDDHQDGGK